jgi:hypothetical protein
MSLNLITTYWSALFVLNAWVRERNSWALVFISTLRANKWGIKWEHFRAADDFQ